MNGHIVAVQLSFRRRRPVMELDVSGDVSQVRSDSSISLSTIDNRCPCTTLTMLKVDASLVDWVRSFGLWTLVDAVGDGLVFLSRYTSVPRDFVYKFSVALLCVHLILQEILAPLLCQLDTGSNPVEIAVALAQREPLSLIIYVLPLLTTLFSLSISLTILLQFQPMDAIVVSGLVSLLVVECLVPLSIALCTVLYVGEFVTIESAALLLVLVWITCSLCSRIIRVALYPNLGHG
jgi:hypothetical protein